MSFAVGGVAVPAVSVARRKRRLLLRLGLVVAAFAVAVIGLEAVLRGFDLFGVNHGRNTLRYRTELLRPTWFAADGSRDLDGTLFRHRPSTSVDFGRFTIATNALGFRGPEIAKEKPPGTFRILVLGDSVTLGWGIDDEFTFCRRVERALGERNGERRFEVINTGHLAYDSMQEAALFEREGVVLDPDLVLLVFVTNDVVEPTHLLIEALLDGQPPAGLPAPGWWDTLRHQGEAWLPALSALLGNLVSRTGVTAPAAAPGTDLHPEMVPAGADGWARSQAALRRIRDGCRARGVPLLVLDHTLPRLPVLAVFCEREAIPCHAFRFTPDELGTDIYNSMIDTHANARGNELLTAKALAILEAAHVLPE